MQEQTVVGVFTSSADAMQVREDLIKSGLAASDIMVTGDAEGTTENWNTDIRDADRGDSGGIGGFFRNLFGADQADYANRYEDAVRSGKTVVTAHVASESLVEEVEEIMERHHAVDIEERGPGFEAERNDAIYTDDVDRQNRLSRETSDTTRIPIVEENVEIGKRQVQKGGVRVYTRDVETPVEREVELRDERVVVSRRPVDRAVSDTDILGLRDGETIEVRETTEEPVVTKTARVVEEVEISRDVSTHTEKVRDTVKKTDVEVENLDATTDSDVMRRSRNRKM